MKSTIQISKKTKDRLKAIGKMGDSYEEVIIFLMDFFNEKCVDYLIESNMTGEDEDEAQK